VEFELRLPDIGEGVAEGEIVRWLVAEGGPIKEDDLLVEILTDKAAMEMPSPVTGVLAKIVAQPGQVVPVGAVLAVIEVAGPGPLRAEGKAGGSRRPRTSRRRTVPRPALAQGMSLPPLPSASWQRISEWTLRPFPGRARKGA